MEQDKKAKFIRMVQEGGPIGKAYFDFYNLSVKEAALDAKTYQLVYLAFLAADGVTEGVRRHTMEAKEAGATREEILSTIMVGLPVSGAKLSDSYVAAVDTLDALEGK